MAIACIASVFMKFALAQSVAPTICMFLILVPAVVLITYNENSTELPLGANKEATITLISHIMEH
jgi:hypothetical protein